MHKILLATLVLVCSGSSFAASTGTGTEVMLVGTFHMSNPGADLHNVKVDNMLAPQRQTEIDAVADALARFKPTRVAVEWPANVVNERYAKFLAGTLPASHNEVVQLGFRLAHKQGLQQVDGLDVEGDFPFEDVETWAKTHGRQTEIDRLMADGEAAVKKATLLQESTSVGNILRHLNDPHEIALNHSFYPPLLTMGSGAEQPGVKLLSAWYARNLAICARLLQTLTPGDHVVVFYGQGHVYLLRQCLNEQPGIKVVSSLDYLPADSGAHLAEVACVDVPAGEQRPDFGCFNVGTLRGLTFDLREVFWHLRRYPSVAAANAVRSANGIVVEGYIPMELNVTGSAIRHAFALVIHDSSRPRGTPSLWQPPGTCGS